MKAIHRSLCPINLTIEILGDKWSLLIIRDMMVGGKKSFRDFMEIEEGIATNILTTRLTMLLKEGIISKEKDPSNKLKLIYGLTEKGIDLMPVLMAIGKWGIKYQPVDLEKYPHTIDLTTNKDNIQTIIKNTLLRKLNTPKV